MDAFDSRARGDASGVKLFLLNVTHAPLRGLAAWVRAVKNRRQISSMRDFDDAQLADIGLKRSDIEDALDRALSGNPYVALVRARQDTLRGARKF
jgi:uncharacterized protein YjiS (DUF1127 family)